MIEVVDNFAPQDYFELIQNHVLSWNQEWYYQANITAGVFGKEGLGKHGFNCHIVQNTNEFLKLLKCFIFIKNQSKKML